MSVLELLAERAPDPVTRRELVGLWPAAVGDEVLTNAVWQVRQALGDGARPAKLVRTHPRRGYQLVARPLHDERESTPTLAVLPFENLTGDEAQEYFVDGMTEAVTNRLAARSRLRVMARGTLRRHEARTVPAVQELARSLGLDFLVTGSVRRTERGLSIAAQLVDCKTGLHRWAGSHAGGVADAPRLQEDAAAAVASAIETRVLPRSPAVTRVKPAAYDAYLRGCFLIERPTVGEVQAGLRYLNEAAAADPGFAPVHAALAKAFYRLASWGQAPGRELVPRVEAAARTALRLDPTLLEAQARVVLAVGFSRWDLGWTARELLELCARDPTDVTVMDGLARCAAAAGRWQEAVGREDELLARDPLAPGLLTARATFLRLAERHQEAESGLRSVLALHPDWTIARIELARALWLQGQGDDAVRELRHAAPGWAACLERSLTGGAGQGDANGDASAGYVAPYWAAERRMWAGDADGALDWLERARDEQQLHAVFAAVEPTFAPLRASERFRRLVAELATA